MSDIKKIMAAICFSPYCEGTFALAADLASKFSAKLILANVINIRDVEAVSTIENMGYDVHANKYIEAIEEERIAELEKLVDNSHFSRDHVKIVFRVGHPYEELMEIIRQEDVDLLVMGTKGRTDLEHVMIGSIADKLFRHSPVTVVSSREKRILPLREKKKTAR